MVAGGDAWPCGHTATVQLLCRWSIHISWAEKNMAVYSGVFHFSRMATPVMAVELRPSTAQARIPSLRGYRDRKSIVCVRRMWIDSSLLPALGPRVLLMLRQSACEKKRSPGQIGCMDVKHCMWVAWSSPWSHGPHACHVRNKKRGPVKVMHATLYTCGSHD